jgi:dTDP-4-dehydrorhamnose reductase
MKILLTGAHGNLGSQLLSTFAAAGHTVLATEREDLDITDEAVVMSFVVEHKPEVIINAAAYNLVDKVEDPATYKIAYAINALGPKYLAAAAKSAGALLVHYSTDYVFAGDKTDGYTEDDATHPLSKYGATKVAGEKFVIESGAKYYLCRLSKIFGPAGTSGAAKQSFVELITGLAKTKPELRIVNEEVGMPSYTCDIAAETLRLITTNTPVGIYHLVNTGKGVTWYQFAEEIFALAPSSTPRIPVLGSEFPRPAPRPAFAAIRNTKLPAMRSRQAALAEYLATIK